MKAVCRRDMVIDIDYSASENVHNEARSIRMAHLCLASSPSR